MDQANEAIKIRCLLYGFVYRSGNNDVLRGDQELEVSSGYSRS